MTRELKFLRTRLGRLIRDIDRKTAGDKTLEAVFAVPLGKAMQIRSQQQRQRGQKLYSWHAPETECICTAVGHNFRLILNWLRLTLRRILEVLIEALGSTPIKNPAS